MSPLLAWQMRARWLTYQKPLISVRQPDNRWYLITEGITGTVVEVVSFQRYILDPCWVKIGVTLCQQTHRLTCWDVSQGRPLAALRSRLCQSRTSALKARLWTRLRFQSLRLSQRSKSLKNEVHILLLIGYLISSKAPMTDARMKAWIITQVDITVGWL